MEGNISLQNNGKFGCFVNLEKGVTCVVSVGEVPIMSINYALPPAMAQSNQNNTSCEDGNCGNGLGTYGGGSGGIVSIVRDDANTTLDPPPLTENSDEECEVGYSKLPEGCVKNEESFSNLFKFKSKR